MNEESGASKAGGDKRNIRPKLSLNEEENAEISRRAEAAGELLAVYARNAALGRDMHMRSSAATDFAVRELNRIVLDLLVVAAEAESRGWAEGGKRVRRIGDELSQLMERL